MGTNSVPETSENFHISTRLSAREHFTDFCLSQRFKTDNKNNLFYCTGKRNYSEDKGLNEFWQHGKFIQIYQVIVNIINVAIWVGLLMNKSEAVNQSHTHSHNHTFTHTNTHTNTNTNTHKHTHTHTRACYNTFYTLLSGNNLFR